ncbi:MAG TPA: S-adenosylmethionine decarboxylase [Gemmatimonadaceae bacterium]|nr:S-adenosylmethionine decarboxylase [Gemmatimonadaceae bacterium]
MTRPRSALTARALVSLPAPPAIVHLSADFFGVAPEVLGDRSLLCGVLVSAAGAAGLQTSGAPLVLQHPDGAVSAILPSDGCHMSLHTMPAREVAILDVLARPGHDVQRALDVVARRIAARSVRAERRERG